MRCARCGKDIHEGETDGVSSLYSPDVEWILCEPCFLDEEAEIDERGTNNLPDTLATYSYRRRAA